MKVVKNKEMFAVLYQTYLRPGKESEFQSAWQIVANYFITQRGALGSCLHQGENGLWVAYSRWPSRAVRDASWPQGKDLPSSELPENVRKAIISIKDCMDEDRKIPDICLEVVNDLL